MLKMKSVFPDHVRRMSIKYLFEVLTLINASTKVSHFLDCPCIFICFHKLANISPIGVQVNEFLRSYTSFPRRYYSHLLNGIDGWSWQRVKRFIKWWFVSREPIYPLRVTRSPKNAGKNVSSITDEIEMQTMLLILPNTTAHITHCVVATQAHCHLDDYGKDRGLSVLRDFCLRQPQLKKSDIYYIFQIDMV